MLFKWFSMSNETADTHPENRKASEQSIRSVDEDIGDTVFPSTDGVDVEELKPEEFLKLIKT